MSFWDQFLEELRTLGQQIVEWTILIVIALVVLIVGRWILGWIRRLVQTVLGVSWLDGLWERSGIKGALRNSEQTPASITATIVYAYLMVALFLIVARILNVSTIEALLERLLVWVPQALLAAFIIIVAAAAANWAAGLVAPFAQDKGVSWLTAVVRVAVIIFGVVFALDVINITFADDLLNIAFAALGVTLAVAFGIGGIDTAKQWWARYGTPDTMASRGGGSDRPPQPGG